MIDVARRTPLWSGVQVVIGIELDNMVRAAQQHQCPFVPRDKASFKLNDRYVRSDR